MPRSAAAPLPAGVRGEIVAAAAVAALQEMGTAAALRATRARSERGRAAAAARWAAHLTPNATRFLRLVGEEVS